MKAKQINEEENTGYPRDIRLLLPYMISVSNNSKLTVDVAVKLLNSLNDAELRDFKQWLKLIEEKISYAEKNNTRHRYY